MKLCSLLFLVGGVLALPVLQQSGNDNATSSCNGKKTAQLIAGINANLMIQAQELQGVQTLASLAKSNTTGRVLPGNAQSDFQLTQADVLAIQQQGINIRANNQKLASELDSPSAKGLEAVAMAQVIEVMQVKTLTGGGESDARTLKFLVAEVKGGTKQNMQNLKDAESQCKRM